MKRKVIPIFFYIVFVFNKLFLRSVRKIVYNKNIVKHKLIPIFFIKKLFLKKNSFIRKSDFNFFSIKIM